MDEPSDEDLMIAIGGGDARAFERLTIRHAGWASRLAGRVSGRPADAADLVQEAMLRVWVKAPVWRQDVEIGADPDAHRIASFKTWLSRILVNLAIDQRRRPIHGDLADIAEPASDAPSALDQVAAAETRARLVRALADLPDRQRIALSLCQFGELGNDEAAAAMGISVGAVESLLVRARRTLRAQLADLIGSE